MVISQSWRVPHTGMSPVLRFTNDDIPHDPNTGNFQIMGNHNTWKSKCGKNLILENLHYGETLLCGKIQILGNPNIGKYKNGDIPIWGHPYIRKSPIWGIHTHMHMHICKYICIELHTYIQTYYLNEVSDIVSALQDLSNPWQQRPRYE